MVFTLLVGRLKAALLFLVGVIRRSLCCFRRRRKSSVDSVPLTTIGIVPSFEPDAAFQDGVGWTDWNDPGCLDAPPSTVQQHIEHYRRQHKQLQQIAQQQQQNQEQQPQPDFFQDMEPEIKRQTKMVVRSGGGSGGPGLTDIAARLAFVPDSFAPTNDAGELGCWEESEERGSWGEAEGWAAQEMLRQKRREEQHRKKNQDKEQRRTLGARLAAVSSSGEMAPGSPPS